MSHYYTVTTKGRKNLKMFGKFLSFIVPPKSIYLWKFKNDTSGKKILNKKLMIV